MLLEAPVFQAGGSVSRRTFSDGAQCKHVPAASGFQDEAFVPRKPGLMVSPGDLEQAQEDLDAVFLAASLSPPP